MSLSEVFTIIKSSVSSASVVVAGVKTLSGSIQELKSTCNVSWLQSTKSKLDDLKGKLEISENSIKNLKQETDSLEKLVIELKQKISTEFPELKRLIVSYSDVRRDVAVAGAIANKAGEIIKLRQDIAYYYILPLTMTTRSGHTQIKTNIKTLPPVDTEVVGVISEKLDRIEILIRDLEKMNTPNSVLQKSANIDGIANIFQEVSEHYAGVETKLHELLNRKILQNFDPKF
jgi:uncharacterized coiled-coil DUF342 family protein